jgi:hypothetical protein
MKRRSRCSVYCADANNDHHPPLEQRATPILNLRVTIHTRSRKSPPRLCEAEAPAARMRAADVLEIKAPTLRSGDESHAHIRIPVARSPGGALAEGSCRRKERGAGCVGIEAPSYRRANGSHAHIRIPPGRSPGGVCAAGTLPGTGMRCVRTRGSKGRSPWNAGVQGVFVTTPPARRRHNEIERAQKGATVFVEAAPARAHPVLFPAGGTTKSDAINRAVTSS